MTTEVVPVDGDAPQEVSVSSKRGLDVGKVEYIMGREQERDLKLIYRIDQLKPFDPEAKTYHKKAKPSDTLIIQLFFEMRDRYEQAKADGDHKIAQEYLKMMLKVSQDSAQLRREALDRLFAWKQHADEKGGLGDMSTEDLMKLAREA